MPYTQWWKSSRSGSQANCVAVRTDGLAVQVMDTKDPQGPVLTFDTGSWAAFVTDAKAGKVDI